MYEWGDERERERVACERKKTTAVMSGSRKPPQPEDYGHEPWHTSDLPNREDLAEVCIIEVWRVPDATSAWRHTKVIPVFFSQDRPVSKGWFRQFAEWFDDYVQQMRRVEEDVKERQKRKRKLSQLWDDDTGNRTAKDGTIDAHNGDDDADDVFSVLDDEADEGFEGDSVVADEEDAAWEAELDEIERDIQTMKHLERNTGSEVSRSAPPSQRSDAKEDELFSPPVLSDSGPRETLAPGSGTQRPAAVPHARPSSQSQPGDANGAAAAPSSSPGSMIRMLVESDDPRDQRLLYRAFFGFRESFLTLPFFVLVSLWELTVGGGKHTLPGEAGGAERRGVFHLFQRAAHHAVSQRWAPFVASASLFFSSEYLVRRAVFARDFQRFYAFQRDSFARFRQPTPSGQAAPKREALQRNAPMVPQATLSTRVAGGAITGGFLAVLHQHVWTQRTGLRWASLGLVPICAAVSVVVPPFEVMYAKEREVAKKYDQGRVTSEVRR